MNDGEGPPVGGRGHDGSDDSSDRSLPQQKANIAHVATKSAAAAPRKSAKAETCASKAPAEVPSQPRSLNQHGRATKGYSRSRSREQRHWRREMDNTRGGGKRQPEPKKGDGVRDERWNKKYKKRERWARENGGGTRHCGGGSCERVPPAKSGQGPVRSSWSEEDSPAKRNEHRSMQMPSDRRGHRPREEPREKK